MIHTYDKQRGHTANNRELIHSSIKFSLGTCALIVLLNSVQVMSD